MVQERLDQMIRERLSRHEIRKQKGRIDGSSTNCIIMVAMDKYSYNPSEDFKASMLEVITANRINGIKELRCVLNCYLSMNSVEYRPIILQVFHKVCAELFLYGKYN
ncbi:hypothetical protein AQUCO_03200070v1 [Aquilegia coerulea]|uniref:Transcription repressor n=1 Tax=Aquilegia coerulea TaxID=218851 RepID=A0A2G5D020_AQUCA|nr:hypothetical protein AQUCO_03200070v1 [Aquilegia coerulea]